MSIKKSDFDHLIAKYQFETRQSDHLFAWLVVDNKVVVRTRRSNGKGDLPAIPLIRRQLHLRPDEFTDAISCRLSREGYVALLRERKVV